MGYYVQLQKAANWLASIQNSNDGWGLAFGQGSSLVNTSEAIYILTKTNNYKYSESIIKGIEFLKRNVLKSVEENPRIRYVTFTLLGLLEHQDKVDKTFIQNLIKWLLEARSPNGAWGHIANDEQQYLFPTCLALNVLYKFGYVNEVETGYNWLVTLKNQRGWGFTPSRESITATSMAIVTLRNIKDTNDSIFVEPKQLILQNQNWTIETEDMPGTPWIHGTYMWVIPALLSLDVEPYNKIIAQGVREINKLNCDNGWKEPTHSLTIRGQYWATITFEAIRENYDPAKHTYLIDTAINTELEINEIYDVVLKPHTRLRMVIPKILFKNVVYLIFILAVILFLGLHRLLKFQEISVSRIDATFSTLLFLLIWFIVTKRKRMFPKFSKVVIIIVGVLSVLSLLTGLSLFDLTAYITNLWK